MQIGGPTNFNNIPREWNTRQTAELMARAARVNQDPTALTVMANLLGVGPCAGCNFVRNHCRCTKVPK
jgi:hypothetical protein